MDFEEYLNARRLRLGITQKELAEKAEISTSYLNLIESGKKKPTPTVIRKIGDALGSDADELLDLAGYRVPELPGEASKRENAIKLANLKVIGSVGAEDSSYLGKEGPEEELDADVVRVLDDSFASIGYVFGDLLMVDDSAPSPGDAVISRVGPEGLTLKIYDRTMIGERVVGRVVGLIRRFGEKPPKPEAVCVPEPKDIKDKEVMKKTLGDIQVLLNKINSELENGSG